MHTLSNFSMAVAFAAFASFAAVPASAAMRIIDGQAYWSGDPGPVDPGAYWTSGQRYADPHHYMSWYGKDPQDYEMTALFAARRLKPMRVAGARRQHLLGVRPPLYQGLPLNDFRRVHVPPFFAAGAPSEQKSD